MSNGWLRKIGKLFGQWSKFIIEISIYFIHLFKKRYRDQLVLWRMDAADYEISISEEDISERITKLGSVDSLIWKNIISLMKDEKKAGYQEALVELLIGDIKNFRN